LVYLKKSKPKSSGILEKNLRTGAPLIENPDPPSTYLRPSSLHPSQRVHKRTGADRKDGALK
jgi:hypothetical protein